MNKTATTISQGCLKELYTQQPTTRNSLLLQIIAFQASEANPKEIILRISDRQAFLDCLLVGPYRIENSRIVSTEYNQLNQVFQKYDIVRIADYFCKIDPSKMCQLRIIVRKLEEPTHLGEILGRPEEISQFIENGNLRTKPIYDNSKLNKFGSEDTPIKIEELAPQPNYFEAENQDRANRVPAGQTAPRPQKQEESLTLADIMNNKQGYFVGRLVRMKFGCKDAKDGPMSFLYLGLVDTTGELVRINLAGRMAIKQSKELKKGRCYLIRGLELFHGEKSKSGPQIRLKDKEYKIYQIQNQAVKSQYKHEYYRWQHDGEWVDSDLVDVVGVIEDIQDKITYKNTSTFQEQREVVRLLVRNSFKTVKISFWADHIHILQSLQLHRKQAILLQDIKKKKVFFLDFIPQSNIILLDDDPDLKERLSEFMPPTQESPQPTCISELLQVFEKQPYSSKLRTLPAKILSINPKWVIYKMCNGCKKKMQKILDSCLQCHQSDFIYKYNCAIELYDASASANCIAFDGPCEKLFARAANAFSLLSQAETKQLCDSLVNQQFLVSVQLKNNRQIIRQLQRVQQSSGGVKGDPSPQ